MVPLDIEASRSTVKMETDGLWGRGQEFEKGRRT